MYVALRVSLSLSLSGFHNNFLGLHISYGDVFRFGVKKTIIYSGFSQVYYFGVDSRRNHWFITIFSFVFILIFIWCSYQIFLRVRDECNVKYSIFVPVLELHLFLMLKYNFNLKISLIHLRARLRSHTCTHSSSACEQRRKKICETNNQINHNNNKNLFAFERIVLLHIE